MKYIVWFSGGIDSTFVAWYLKQQGHDVLLVNLKNTYEPNKCCSIPTELFKISDFLWLDLKIVDVTKDFKKFVIDDFVSSYLNWKTPNPCINCNEQVRFKILNKIRQEVGFDKVATGHYVKLKILQVNSEMWRVNTKSHVELDLISKKAGSETSSGWEDLGCPFSKSPDNLQISYTFAISQDVWKDQSYMLYRLIKFQDILEHLEFPLWKFKKTEIKEILKKEKIPVNTSKESQNVCFIPDDDYPRFIKQQTFVNLPSGKIVDVKWNYLWEHKGLLYYTIWQRKGLNLNTNEKKYVVKIDWENNLLIVGDNEDLMEKEVNLAEKLLLLPGLEPNLKQIKQKIWKVYGKIRYKWSLQEIEEITENKVIFKEPVRAVTPGQHLVLYAEKDWELVVIGGGLIS